MAESVDDRKRMIRADLRERRQALGELERERLTVGLTEQLRQLVTRTGATSLSCFLSTPSEPNVRPFVNWAEANGICVLFPITREDGLLDWTVGEHETEAPGLFGMPEPSGELLGPIAVGDVDLMIIPAAAIDEHGMRLGWGRGYFDKTLGSMRQRPPVYAVVFDHERLPSVPHELHDQAVDGVVTPTAITTFTKA